MILLRSDLLPLVIDRDMRTDYITALESADSGDMAPLTNLFARLERTAILQALSVDADAEISRERTLTSAVIGALAAKFARRKEGQLAELRQVNSVARSLRSAAKASLEESLGEIENLVEEASGTSVREGGSDRDSAHWFKFEVVSSAKEAGKFANLAEDHYFLNCSVRVGRERLIFVVSFHHVGRELSGIMEATAFAKLKLLEESEERESVEERFFLCSVEPFVFTHNTNPSEVTAAFARWLDQALAVALKEFGDRL
jgi:hypothetical protein